MNIRPSVCVVLVSIATAVRCDADVIFQPDTLTASTEVSAAWAAGLAGDQSGLNGTYVSGTDDFDTIMGSLTHANANTQSTGWASNAPTLNNDPNGAGAEWLRMDLGQEIRVQRLGIWMQLDSNGPGPNFSTTNEFEVFSSTNDTFATPVLTSLGIFNLPAVTDGAGFIFDVTDVDTQFLMLNVRTLHPFANAHASFGEVAIDGNLPTAAVPEPKSTLFLAAIGLCLAGCRWQRSKNAAIRENMFSVSCCDVQQH